LETTSTSSETVAVAPAAGSPGPRDGSPPPHVKKERRTRNVGWRSRDVVRAAALVMALYVGLRLLWFANTLVFVVFLGTLFGLAVSRAVDHLERVRIRRGVGAALVVFVSIAAIVGLGAIVAPTVREQGQELRRQLPTAVDRIEEWINRRPGVIGALVGRSLGGTEVAPAGGADTGAGAGAPRAGAAGQGAETPAARAGAGDSASAQEAGAPDAAATLRERMSEQLSGATRYLFPFLSSTAAVLAGVVLVIFLAIYIGAEPKLYHDGLMHLFPHRARKRAGEVLSEMAIVLRKWLVTQLIAMVTIGVVTTVVLLLLDVRAAFALGLIAGLLEFVPTVGPLLSAIPAVAMGFIDSPQKALYVALAYWGIQFLENNLLIPTLMRGGLDLPPALTIVAQALMTLVFGFLGLMVAVPLAAAVMVPIKMLYVEDVVGDQITVRDTDDEDDDD
jgi:predicted PurR-regulated permease PerM